MWLLLLGRLAADGGRHPREGSGSRGSHGAVPYSRVGHRRARVLLRIEPKEAQGFFSCHPLSQ